MAGEDTRISMPFKASCPFNNGNSSNQCLNSAELLKTGDLELSTLYEDREAH